MTDSESEEKLNDTDRSILNDISDMDADASVDDLMDNLSSYFDSGVSTKTRKACFAHIQTIEDRAKRADFMERSPDFLTEQGYDEMGDLLVEEETLEFISKVETIYDKEMGEPQDESE
jgi:hypothetical protein